MANLPAVRTEDSKTSSELIQLVSFQLDQEEYGVEVLKVREIIRMVNITHMPNTDHSVEGIINLRGKVIPIISMRKKFGLMETENNQHTRVIIMDVAGELIGFTVDSVSEVIRVSASEIQPSPAVAAGGVGQEYIAGVINHADRLLVLLNLEMMFSNDRRELIENI
ncbi:MAG: purine-binding chemotaxis protein CheW [Desulfuromonadales bacterium]|nr:purine-binding chemotaxis protein CheW [Desulfuromonadales bacterium]